MTKKSKKVKFDLSTLSLEELIKVYEDITNFLKFLDETKIEEEKEGED